MAYCRKHLISLAKDKSMNGPPRPDTGRSYSLYSANISGVSWSIVPSKRKSKIPGVKTESYSTKSCPMDSEGASTVPNIMMKST